MHQVLEIFYSGKTFFANRLRFFTYRLYVIAESHVVVSWNTLYRPMPALVYGQWTVYGTHFTALSNHRHDNSDMFSARSRPLFCTACINHPSRSSVRVCASSHWLLFRRLYGQACRFQNVDVNVITLAQGSGLLMTVINMTSTGEQLSFHSFDNQVYA